MSVHYKFKSALEYDTVTFDGLHISVKDLKNAILQQKRIGKSTDFDLQVTNAQTKEVYEDENTLIPKNTSLLIARIPILTPKTKPWEGYGGDHTPPPKVDEGPIAKTADLSSLDASEDDKIKAMMSQSTQDYDPSNYMKIRGANQMGVVPPHYRCHKCHQGGHWIKDCTFGQGSDPIEIKKSTGIPRNFLVPVDGPQVPGAMMTPNGQYAVPLLDLQAYNQKVTSAPIVEQKTEIPEDLLCSICSDLLADAVMIPCCGNSFCDECIRSVLLESEDHECPDCHEKDISPDTLIPNRFLRTSVANFGNTTGYVKKSIYREKHEIQKIQNNGTPSAKEFTPPLEPEREPTEKPNPDEKTIISEADSTEHSKNVAKDNNKKLAELETNAEGPPGVSPKTSPKEQQEHREKRSKERERTKERSSKEREFRERKGTRRNSRNRYRGDSPRKNARRMRSSKSPYNSPVSRGEERSGTPTVDEPTTGNGIFNPPVTYGNSTSMPPLMPHMNPMPGGPPPFPSNHPPPISSYPPSQGPPPNYRMPPPGAAPYLPPGSYPPVPPRALYDTSRPPIGGLPPSFNPSFPPRGHREFSRRLRERTPPGVIDDPLAAFNRMLREKDERKRRAKRRSSYSRSRSRSPRSFSRSPVRRRSRSPRMSRRSRSRSRSFSLSRSRSRSFSGSPRGTPYRSPARRSPPPPRRGPSRYKSPLPPSRSPPPRSRHERHRSREFDDDRDYLYKERSRNRDRRSRDRDRYYDSYDDRRGGSRQQQQWAASQQRPPMQDSFYPPEIQPGYPPNRFGAGPPRDFGLPPPPFSQPLPQTIHNIQRQFQDIHPPGVDDDIAPPGVDEPPPPVALLRSPKKEEKAPKRSDKEKKRHDRTPEKKAPSSPKRRSKSNTPDRHNKKKRKESSDREERKRDDSDDDKGKRSKDKKKHKEKKETERKKKKDKKEKHKKESKDKKSKEEFKQVIPKNIEDDFMEDEPRKPEETTSPVKEKHVRTEEEPVVAMKEKTKTDEDRTRKPKEEKSHRLKDEERAKKPKEAEKHKIEETPDENLTESSPIKKPKERKVEPEEPIQQPSPERKPELYTDILEEGVDTEVMEEYGKIEKEINKTGTPEPVHKELEEEEEEEKDVLELHSNDIDLKGLDKSDILAPMPEKSKWEVEEDVPLSPKDTYKSDSKSDKSGKVTNEVLKRAENAIFAKAINAIRPIEIKKISTDRAKLYSGEREVEKTHNKLQITVSSALTDFPSETSQHAARLPVKERLGIKVEDPEKVINLIKKRARTISPFSRRGEGGRNHEPGDRRTETESRSRHDKGRRSRSKQRDSSKDRHRSRAEGRRRSRNKRSEERRDRNRNKSKEKSSTSKRDDDDANDERNRRKRTKSRAESEEPKHKRKDKKPKKEKTKKKEETIKEPTKNEDKEEPAKPSAVTKRKPTIDEASFEPDYDLESHSDEENTKKKAKKHSEEEKSSSSESASSSTSEEERKKKKRKKHRKKRKKESSSSNTSESESDSSDSDKGKKRKKHRKSKKKKKRSKHK